VLIAEDDLTSRSMLVAMVKKWGFQPISASDGLSAWDLLQKPDSPSLVIMDWNMPGMNGLEVCQRIRGAWTSNPPYIILLTARGEKKDIIEGLEAGANDYVSKPYDTDELRARIRVGERMVQLQSDLNQARETLAHEAMHDSLTGVFNRRAILEALNMELARSARSGTGYSIGLVDLDHFKKVNDTYGHQAGDAVLCALVKQLKSNLREYDRIGRYGGEEFLVVAPDSDGTHEEGLYERLRHAIAVSSVATPSGLIAISVSIGVARGACRATSDSIIAAADAALYQAKAQGRNQVCYSDPALKCAG
jgi:diguanylate cyclase (GGDEF)-like protein